MDDDGGDDGGDGEVGATKGGNVNTFASQLMINKNSRIKKIMLFHAQIKQICKC